MRIGLFGGTFNPVHLGHLKVIREVQAGLALDHVFFIPAALPPHKAPDWVADAEDRLAMLRLALTDSPFFSTSDIELQRSGPSYTIDTVRYFNARYRGQDDLLLIIGLDAFLEIDTWKSYEALFKAIQLLVMSRPSTHRPQAEGYQHRIETFLQSAISNAYRYSRQRACFTHPAYQPVTPFAVSPLAISATQIRNRIQHHKPIQHLVPEDVAEYIKERGLYQ